MDTVSRVDDTVRRPAGAWTDSVHALLRHVRSRGVPWVPEPRGRDRLGREVVSFLEGEVPSYPMPGWVWDDELLADAGRHLRRYHDATVDFPRAGRSWQLPAHQPDEVICHNDFAPYNLVFRGRALSGVIDFGTASPGPRAWDLAYLAYRLVPLTAPSNPDGIASPDSVRAARLERLCDAYAGGATGAPAASVTAAAVLALAPARLDELAAFTAARATAGGPSTLAGHVALYHADAEYLGARSAELATPRPAPSDPPGGAAGA